MRLKTFQAQTMTEAMRQIRDELGENAIIVATHRSRRGRGVEITAAVEPPPDNVLDVLSLDARAANNLQRAGLGGGSDVGSEAVASAGRLEQSLAFHGVPTRLAQHLIRCAAAARNRGNLADGFAAALDLCFGFVPIATLPTRPILLTGQPGSGKTVTVAKLATRAVMAGCKVTVITCDTVRAGGVAQLAAFINLLEQPLIAVDDPQQLAKAVAEADPSGPIFIDTPGTNPHRTLELDDIRACAAASGAESILVMPAGTDPAEAADTATGFAAAGVAALLPTRLDIARRYGGLLAAADAAALTFAGASAAAFVGQGLHTLRAASLARLLLRSPGSGEIEAEFDEAAA
jgi:flagellar biosynthesis protein FlhF